MILAVEDALAESLARRILGELRPELQITVPMRLGGRAKVEARLAELNRTAQSVPVFAMIDLDRPEPCPPALVQQHFRHGVAPRMLFRVAVFEAESWVLADAEGIAQFLGVPEHRLPPHPDEEPDPKRLLVNLARRSSKKAIREDLVPAPGSTAQVGPAFNAQLTNFVTTKWSLQRARTRSRSLDRAAGRIVGAFA